MNTDEWRGYSELLPMGQERATACRAHHEWRRHDDADGVREFHVNMLEDLWTGTRNFLRLFGDVGKKYLYQYAAMFEWDYNAKRATPRFLCAVLGVR